MSENDLGSSVSRPAGIKSSDIDVEGLTGNARKERVSVPGIGKPFNGSLICAPFLEFKDTDDGNEVRLTFVPVTKEGFVFFYNKKTEKLLFRFVPRREEMVRIAMKELEQNLWCALPH